MLLSRLTGRKHPPSTTILLTCIILLIASNSEAKSYKCKDSDGNTVFSDTACSTVERTAVKDYSGPSGAAIEKKSVDACLSYWKNSKPYLSNSDTRIEGHQINMVNVKEIGPRKMIHITVSSIEVNDPSKNGGRTSQQLSCLMLGDGVTVNTMGYELE